MSNRECDLLAENAEEDLREEQFHAMRSGDGQRTEDQVRCLRQSIVFMNLFLPLTARILEPAA